MVQEVRKVILTVHEVVSALESFRRITPKFLPAGQLEKYEVLDTDQLKIFMTVPSGSTTQSIEIKMSCADLLKPIIRFCIENNIMLPRDGRKVVMLANGDITLCIELDLNIDVSEHIKPLHASQLNEVVSGIKIKKI